MGEIGEEMLVAWMEAMRGKVGSVGVVAEVVERGDDG